MKKIQLITILVLLFSSFAEFGYSAPDKYVKKGNNNTIKAVTSGCLQATASTYLDLNNVKAYILDGGDMWVKNGVAAYEIPKGSGHMALYAGVIWVGGTDVNGQLRIAAMEYRSQGVDFWPGPLVAKGDNRANVTPDICSRYDKLFKLTRSDVQTFKDWYNSSDRDADFPGYTVPEVIMNWPANGPIEDQYDRFLAPFHDADGDGEYDPIGSGDYPNYIFGDDYNCNQVPERNADSLGSDDMHLYGDQTIWWVYNDKGNVHTATKGAGIGMEFRSQAFEFSTNDDLNNMSFYNYQIINRSTYSLTDAYFGVWTDGDLGQADDDKCGCDVGRGLGYIYNGDDDDGDGVGQDYGKNPPAVGIDFFEGPYQDADQKDNLSSYDFNDLLDCSKGYRDYDGDGVPDSVFVPEEGEVFLNGNINGLNFGDGIKDNERWGMRRFLYFNNGSGVHDDPSTGIDYYRYLQGIWKDGTRMTYGGEGYDVTDVSADFICPGNSDICNWGTGGAAVPGYGPDNPWKMGKSADKRIVQSAGPFTLKPGQVNFITTGAVWARSYEGKAERSVSLLVRADDKAQALFENCFRMIDGPDAPELSVVEMDQKIVLHISNPSNSNNYLEKYDQKDNLLPDDSLHTYDRHYRFQGYQVFQLVDANATVNDIGNESKAILVYQCDKKDGVTRLINYTFNKELGINEAEVMVNGLDQGISHTIEITQDAFSKNKDRTIVNDKKYYFVAIAYAYNNYKTYDPNDAGSLDGQKTPYLASRKSARGAIKVHEVIPHKNIAENGGTTLNSDYGDKPAVTRLAGIGSGYNYLKFADGVEDSIVAGYDMNLKIRYATNYGPVNVKIIDPLSVEGGDYYLGISPDSVNFTLGHYDFVNKTNTIPLTGFILDSKWFLVHKDVNGVLDTTYSGSWLSDKDEYLFPEYGISVEMKQIKYPDGKTLSFGYLETEKNGFVGAEANYEDNSKPWISFLPDADGVNPYNWIRCGKITGSTGYNDYIGRDADGEFEKVLGGTWAPYMYCSIDKYGPADIKSSPISIIPNNKDINLPSVNFVITKDKSKWTRCPVLEMAENSYDPVDSSLINPNSEGQVLRFSVRAAPSKDKDGNVSIGTGVSTDESSPNYISDSGMSWFPGYAVDVETGRRLNIAFGEDSYLLADNGRDMLWNPTSRIITKDGKIVFGGKHYIYIFASDTTLIDQWYMPPYDGGKKLYHDLVSSPSSHAEAMRFAAWVTIPLSNIQTYDDIPDNDYRVELRVANSYGIGKFDNEVAGATNKNYPYFYFNLDPYVPVHNSQAAAKSALDQINVVPNPYYGGNSYELTQVENLIKFINLPQKCTIQIYNLSGTKVKTIEKDNSSTIAEWDLKNDYRVPIAGGIYIIHVEVPGVGEKVLKWFGVLRPDDLSSF